MSHKRVNLVSYNKSCLPDKLCMATSAVCYKVHFYPKDNNYPSFKIGGSESIGFWARMTTAGPSDRRAGGKTPTMFSAGAKHSLHFNFGSKSIYSSLEETVTTRATAILTGLLWSSTRTSTHKETWPMSHLGIKLKITRILVWKYWIFVCLWTHSRNECCSNCSRPIIEYVKKIIILALVDVKPSTTRRLIGRI